MGFIYASERRGDFAHPIRAIGSTAQTAFPLSNVLDYRHPYKQARCTANTSGTTYIGVDLGTSPSAISAIVVGNVNVASVKIQAHSADSWGTPSHDSGALTVAKDDLTGRYNYFYQPSSWTSNNRYIRVLSNTATETDGTNVLAVGYILVLTNTTTLSTPLADPIDAAPIEPILTADGYGGADHTLSVGETRAEITLAQSVSASDNDSEILTLFRQNGESGDLVWYWNNSDTSQVYVVRRRGRAALTYTGPNSRRVAGVVLREQI